MTVASGARRVEIPCTKALKRMLDEPDRKTAVILTTKTTLTWKALYFNGKRHRRPPASSIFIFMISAARLSRCSREPGCTVPQIASITGHSLKTVTDILEKYLARTRALASEAVTLFENAKSTEFANRLQTRPQSA